MNYRFALSVAIVVVGAVLFMADTVVGEGPFSFPPKTRLAVAPTGEATTGPIAGPSLPLGPLPVLSPNFADVAQREARALAASQIEGATSDDLWANLAGFSGKSNQEREQYVAEYLFPKAGLSEIRKQSVPFINGKWGAEYGSWNGLSNVIATRQGTLPASSRKLIVLGAHFDKVTYPSRSGTAGKSDGILDNGTGVAVMATMLQAIRSPLNDIEVVAFATEEPDPYFWGSRIYFGKIPDEKRVLFVANFDCLGTGNLALIRDAAEPSLSTLASKVAESQRIPLAFKPGGQETVSDHVVAQYFGFKVLSFTSEGWDWHNIHVPEDNLREVDKETLYRSYLLSLRIIAFLDAYLAEVP